MNNLRKRWVVKVKATGIFNQLWCWSASFSFILHLLRFLVFGFWFFVGSLFCFSHFPAPPPLNQIKNNSRNIIKYKHWAITFLLKFSLSLQSLSRISSSRSKSKNPSTNCLLFFHWLSIIVNNLPYLPYPYFALLSSLPPTRLPSLNPAPTPSLAEWLALSSNHHARAGLQHLRNPNFPLKLPTSTSQQLTPRKIDCNRV